MTEFYTSPALRGNGRAAGVEEWRGAGGGAVHSVSFGGATDPHRFTPSAEAIGTARQRLEAEIAPEGTPTTFTGVVGESEFFLGDDLLPLLVLAIGAALAVGSGAALLRPRGRPRQGELARAPVGRSLVMILIGTVAAVWALASLVAG